MRIIFVCTFIFSLFVFLFSSRRIIFEIKNKKEKRKVAVEFLKHQTQLSSKNAGIFGEKEQTSDSVSMFASANKRQERSLRRRRGLTSFFRA